MLTGVDLVDASELRVAQMAADDLSNKDIAQALSSRSRTVECT